MIIRNATEDDFQQCIELGRMMHGESAYKDLPFNDVMLLKLGYMALHNPHTMFFIVAETNDKKLVGMIMAQITEYYFCHEFMLQDIFIYVSPEARGTTTAVRMLRKLHEWGKQKEVSDIVLGNSCEVDAAMVSKLFNGTGYKQIGTIHRARIR